MKEKAFSEGGDVTMAFVDIGCQGDAFSDVDSILGEDGVYYILGRGGNQEHISIDDVNT